jgi:hypothetical protein
VFQPERPIIRGRIEDCLRAERALELDALLSRALDARRVLEIEPA